MDEATFGQVVHEAAADALVHVNVLEKRMQGRDHPVLLGVPGDVLPEVLHPEADRVAGSGHGMRKLAGGS